MEQQIILYEPKNGLKMQVKTDGDTVWLTREQLCQLFGRHQSVIARHISNVFKEGELPREGFMQILHKTSAAGGRPVALYNLMICGVCPQDLRGLSPGYSAASDCVVRTVLFVPDPLKVRPSESWR